MTDLITREWNGQVIRQREDGYINATDMCTSCSKYFNDWFKTNGASRYLEALSSRLNIPIRNNPEAKILASAQPQGFQALVNVIKGGDPQEQGTWIHRKVAIRLAQWLSPELAIQVDDWIEELFETGKVELTQHPEQNNVDALTVLNQMMQTFNQQQEKLNEHDNILEQHQETIDTTANELELVKEKLVNYRNNPNFQNAKFSINQFCRIKGLEPNAGNSRSAGRKLTKLCTVLEIDFNVLGAGRSNEYPHWLLEALLESANDFSMPIEDFVRRCLQCYIDE